MATEFELEGRRFEVQRLTPEDACMGIEVLGKALGPALSTLLLSKAEGEEEAPVDWASLLSSLLSQASQVMVLLKLFAPVTKYDRSQNGAMVDLRAFLKGRGEIFEGRVDLMVAFLVHAVRGEYAAFLAGNNAIAALLPKAPASDSSSPTEPAA
jgi:hypothetical protein